jgi:hypothetical protein
MSFLNVQAATVMDCGLGARCSLRNWDGTSGGHKPGCHPSMPMYHTPSSSERMVCNTQCCFSLCLGSALAVGVREMVRSPVFQVSM